MAQTRAQIKADYPLPAYNFKVTVGGEVMAFTEVSGLSMQYETIAYRHGLSFIEGGGLMRFTYKQASRITMKKGVGRSRTALYEWFTDRQPRRLVVALCDEAGDPLVEWAIGAAVPVKLDAPAFNASTNEVAIDTLEVSVSSFTVRVVTS